MADNKKQYFYIFEKFSRLAGCDKLDEQSEDKIMYIE